MEVSAVGDADHWEGRYRQATQTAPSWRQQHPGPSLDMLDKAGVISPMSVIDVGGGDSPVVDALLQRGHTDLTVLDISATALAAAKDRLGAAGAAVSWICTDLLSWTPLRKWDVWHDRAVFHFLTTERERETYRALLRRALNPGGVVIVGAFAADGPTSCSGLPTARYDDSQLHESLGPDLQQLAAMRQQHQTPAGGTQAFTWAAYRQPSSPPHR